MLPVSMDCPFVIAPSVFSNVYLSVAHSIESLLIIRSSRFVSAN